MRRVTLWLADGLRLRGGEAGAFLLPFLLPFLLYAFTRAPGLTFVDAGELAAVASTLGIAHPTGYPLFTLLGRVLVALPGPLAPFDRLSLFSASCAAVAAAFVAASARLVLGALGVSAGSARAAALAAGLTFAMGQTVWSQAVIVEVYTLHVLFIAVLVYLTLRAMRTGGAAGATATGIGGMRVLLLAGYAAGLAMANHLSAALLLPALAYGVGRARGARQTGRSLPLVLLMVVAGLSIYLYLPVRSALDPPLDWGDPDTPGAFFRHTTGAVYRVWFLSSPEAAMRQLGRFLNLLSVEMTPVALVPVIWGLIVCWRRQPIAAHATVLLFVLNLLYAVNYDIHDIDAYFLPAFVVLALWLGVGLGSGLDAGFAAWRTLRAGARRRAVRWAAALFFPLLTLAWNAGAASQRGNHLVADYTAAMFGSLDAGAVLLSRQWDHFCSAAIYEQRVRGIRPDVTVLEKELLRRSWYLSQLERWDPRLAGDCRGPIEAFRGELAPFETGGRYRSEVLQELYVAMINCLLDRALAERPAYLTPDALEPGIARGLTMVPVGLAMRLYPQPPLELPPSPPTTIRGLRAAWASEKKLEQQLAGLVLDMDVRRARFLAACGKGEEAMAAAEGVLAIAPSHRDAVDLRAALLAQGAGRAPAPPRPRTARRRSGQSVKRPSTSRSMSSAIPAGSLIV